MPFQSKAQASWMFANHPKMAERWAHHTKDIKALPEHVDAKEALAKLAFEWGERPESTNVLDLRPQPPPGPRAGPIRTPLGAVTPPPADPRQGPIRTPLSAVAAPVPAMAKGGDDTSSLLAAALSGAGTGSVLGAGTGGVLGGALGLDRGNVPEGLGRGLLRGGATGGGAGLGAVLGALAGKGFGHEGLGALAGTALGGGAGYVGAGRLLGKPKRDKDAATKQAAQPPGQRRRALERQTETNPGDTQAREQLGQLRRLPGQTDEEIGRGTRTPDPSHAQIRQEALGRTIRGKQPPAAAGGTVARLGRQALGAAESGAERLGAGARTFGRGVLTGAGRHPGIAAGVGLAGTALMAGLGTNVARNFTGGGQQSTDGGGSGPGGAPGPGEQAVTNATAAAAAAPTPPTPQAQRPAPSAAPAAPAASGGGGMSPTVKALLLGGGAAGLGLIGHRLLARRKQDKAAADALCRARLWRAVQGHLVKRARAEAAAAVVRYLDRVAAGLPVTKQAGLRTLQCSLTLGRPLYEALAGLYPAASAVALDKLASALVRGAVKGANSQLGYGGGSPAPAVPLAPSSTFTGPMAQAGPQLAAMA